MMCDDVQTVTYVHFFVLNWISDVSCRYLILHVTHQVLLNSPLSRGSFPWVVVSV